MNLATFAAKVNRLATSRCAPRHGDRKVLISFYLENAHQLGLTEQEMRTYLLQANRQGLVTLARIDYLGDSASPERIQERQDSHIQDGNSDFHAVIDRTK